MERRDFLERLEEERIRESEAHAVIVRHAQSLGNAGFKTDSHDQIGVTDLGLKQAEHLADFWWGEPSAIVHSPFLRTEITAGPTKKRFPYVNVTRWPVQEFTYLNPKRYNGTTKAEREFPVEQYWGKADPDYFDGGEAESFQDFWGRATTCELFIFRHRPKRIIFSHEQFINLMRFRNKFPEFRNPTSEAMKRFREFSLSHRIANTARVAIWKTAEGLIFDEPSVSHLPADLVTGLG